MSSDGSVTCLIGMLKEDGDRAAAQRLWADLLPEAGQRRVGRWRRSVSRRVSDEEDVALSAFESFYRRAERDQFPKLEDREDLWQLLFDVLTVQTATSRTTKGGSRASAAG